jgi:transposase-like protein
MAEKAEKVDEEQDGRDGPRRWTAKRRAALVLSIVRGDTSVAEAARQHGLTAAEVEEWRERFLASAENGLRCKPLDDEALQEAQIKRLKQKVGELVMDIDILKEAAKGHPTVRQTQSE